MKFCLEFFLILCSFTTVFTVCPSCFSDEVCNNITNNCDCNPSKYIETEQYPQPEITCNYDMVLRIPRCQMERNGYDSSSLRLINPNCRLSTYPDNISYLGLLWHIGTGECGNIKTENSSHITYSNILYINSKTSAFITKNNITISFSCSIPRNMDIGSFPLNVVAKNVSLTIPGVIGKITLTMEIYTDSAFTTPVTTSTQLVVEQTVYVSLVMQTVDIYALKVVNMYVSNSSNPSADPRYYLLQNGCPNLNLGAFQLAPIWNGQFTQARFQMKMAKISGSDFIYLYANVAMCNNSCTQNCNSRSAIDQSYDSTIGVRLDFSFSVKWALSSLLLPLILMTIM
ncbi:hypothetical protein XELAEV_18015052mg [Xenopus laevis]|uniref:ZP domain-containing protein n=1 Tax=Xenopus laevis TaxID=8355 RepID=A0A974DIY3_XENLA|nr:hypothetical protein XELAEV_18015052mg [Xenopus laevis]